jgi:hypothetical protein
MSENRLADLRKPFPPAAVGKLPKPYKADSPKGNCKECGGYHGLPAVHLDYVGHAVVTNRLLDIDPQWSWEPMGLDPQGLPALDRSGNLWIRLTVAGVTRIGVGDGPSLKVAIGDAIRNAAMRFGVALDLWSKEELEGPLEEHSPEAKPELAPSLLKPPPLVTAKARAWTALKKIKPDFHNDELQSFTAAALEARGSSIADATTDTWNDLAQEWEAAA